MRLIGEPLAVVELGQRLEQLRVAPAGRALADRVGGGLRGLLDAAARHQDLDQPLGRAGALRRVPAHRLERVHLAARVPELAVDPGRLQAVVVAQQAAGRVLPGAEPQVERGGLLQAAGGVVRGGGMAQVAEALVAAAGVLHLARRLVLRRRRRVVAELIVEPRRAAEVARLREHLRARRGHFAAGRLDRGEDLVGGLGAALLVDLAGVLGHPDLERPQDAADDPRSFVAHRLRLSHGGHSTRRR